MTPNILYYWILELSEQNKKNINLRNGVGKGACNPSLVFSRICNTERGIGQIKGAWTLLPTGAGGFNGHHYGDVGYGRMCVRSPSPLLILFMKIKTLHFFPVQNRMMSETNLRVLVVEKKTWDRRSRDLVVGRKSWGWVLDLGKKLQQLGFWVWVKGHKCLGIYRSCFSLRPTRNFIKASRVNFGIKVSNFFLKKSHPLS